MAENLTRTEDTGDYLYRHVTPSVLMEDLGFRAGTPGPGDQLPEIDLPTPRKCPSTNMLSWPNRL